MFRATRRRARSRHPAPPSSGCGRSARFRTIARSRPPPMPRLAVTLYGFLMREGTIPPDWFSAQVAQADRTDGDIDTLANRIAHIRTWTFAANRPDWLADPEHWQGVTRGVEDRLSDALHERLAERFVDRRTSVLMRRLRENTMLETEITKSGEVVVEGHPIGRLAGFQFAADSASAGPEGKALRAAAQKALAGEIDARAAKLGHAPDDQFALSSDGGIRWHRRAGRQADCRRRCAAPACAHSLRRATDGRLARCRAGAARSVAQGASGKGARAADRARLGGRHHRHCARRRFPVDRGSRRAGTLARRRGGEGSRPGSACDAAQIRRSLRRLSPLSAEPAQARARARSRCSSGR